MSDGFDSDTQAFSSPCEQGRYVILWHQWPAGPLRCFEETETDDAVLRRGGDHFDWMLESDSCLATWATADRISIAQESSAGAIRLPDHRAAYLDLEGPVSGGRGTVTQVESGRFLRISSSEDRYEILTMGARSGLLVFERTSGFNRSIRCDRSHRTWCGKGVSFWRISFRRSAEGTPTRAEAN